MHQTRRTCLSKTNILEAYSEYLSPWIKYLIEKSTRVTGEDGQKSYAVDGNLLDCLPANLIMDSNQPGFSLIDQEWEFQGELDTGYIIFRGIYRDLKENLAEIEQTPLLDERSIFDVLVFVFSAHQLGLDRDKLQQYIALEATIQKQLIVYQLSHREMVSYLENFVMAKRSRKIPGRKGESLAADNTKIKEIVALRQEIKAIKRTYSWRIGRFLTGIFRIFSCHS